MLTFPNFDSIETIKDIFYIDFNDNLQEFTEFYDGIVYKSSIPFVL